LWPNRLILPGIGNYVPLDNFLVVKHPAYEPNGPAVRMENRRRPELHTK